MARVKIFLDTVDGGTRFRFPTTPPEITIKNGTSQQSYKIIGKGEVAVPRGTKVEEISWEGYFYGPSKRGEPLMSSYRHPRACVQALEAFRDSGTRLRLMVLGFWINRDVTISSFEWKMVGGHGNVRYSITFSRWKELNVKVLKKADAEPTQDNAAADTPEDRPEPPAAQTYTIQAGDNLCKIARSLCGGEANWTKLYEANKDVIEAAAQRYGRASSDHGHWIYAGVTLTIPA